MRVLHVEAGKHLYGGALQVYYLTAGLNQFGVESFLACPPNAELLDVIDDSVVQLPIKMKGDLDVALIFRLKALIKQHQIDLLHLHSRRGADLFGVIAGRLSNVPVVISRRVDNKELAWFAKAKYHAANKVVSISEGIRTVLVRQGVRPEHVTTVLSAVDTKRFTPLKAKQWFNNEFDLKENCFVIAIIAQLIPRKGHQVLFKALKNLENKLINHKLLIFGKGPLEQELKNDVCKLGLEHIIQFCGFREDIDKILPNLDLIIHPALTEGLGVSLLQAAACGVPIIASSAGGIPEVVADGQNGWLIKPNNIEQLTATLEIVLFSTPNLSIYKSAGRELAEEKFSTERMVEGNFQVYQEVLSDSIN